MLSKFPQRLSKLLLLQLFFGFYVSMLLLLCVYLLFFSFLVCVCFFLFIHFARNFIDPEAFSEKRLPLCSHNYAHSFIDSAKKLLKWNVWKVYDFVLSGELVCSE